MKCSLPFHIRFLPRHLHNSTEAVKFKLIFNKNVLTFWFGGKFGEQIQNSCILSILANARYPILQKKIAWTCAFRRNPWLAAWLIVVMKIKCWRIFTCGKVFITSSFSSPERPVPVSQRDPGMRISRAEFPPAKKDRRMRGRECHKLWSDITPFLSRPHEVLQDPSLRLNASYYITKQILPPLNRVFSLIGLDVFTW